jgi:hypothetical protein
MKYRATLILFFIALGLAAAYFFYFQPIIKEKELIADFEKRFFRADTSEIEFLRLDTGQGPITISKSGESWKITKPAEYLPDLGAIDSLFKALAKGRLIKVVGGTEDLDAFEFKTVHVILSLGYSGTIDVLRIAGESPSGAGHYAYSERLGKIFLVDKEFVTAMNLKPLDLREKRLFIFNREELGRIKIHKKNDTVEIEKRNNGWYMVSPFPMKTDNDDMNTLVDALHTQKSEAFIDWKPDLAGLERKISLELNDTNGISLGAYEVYFWGTEWDRGIVAHHPGSSEALRVRRDFWILLNREYSHFAYRNMISINPLKVRKIAFHSGGDIFVLEKRDSLWSYENTQVPMEQILELINSLNSWKAEKLINENRDLGREHFVLEVEYEGSRSRVVVSDFNMDYEISGAMLFAARKGKVKKEKIDYLYARSANLESSAIVRSIDIENILDIVRGLRDG